MNASLDILQRPTFIPVSSVRHFTTVLEHTRFRGRKQSRETSLLSTTNVLEAIEENEDVQQSVEGRSIYPGEPECLPCSYGTMGYQSLSAIIDRDIGDFRKSTKFDELPQANRVYLLAKTSEWCGVLVLLGERDAEGKRLRYMRSKLSTSSLR